MYNSSISCKYISHIHVCYSVYVLHIYNPASAYATHILNNRHEYGTANDTLKLIQPCRKSKKMNHWENMYIQIYRQQNLLITEQQVNEPNALYELVQLPHAIRDSSQPNIPQTSTSGMHTHR